MQISCRFGGKGCGKIVDIPTTPEQMRRWKIGGELIQAVFPELNAEQREMLMTGICNDCWTKLFPTTEESEG